MILNGKKNELNECGYKDHNKSARVRAPAGTSINDRGLAIDGIACSFVNNFRTSAKGWGRPESPTLLGPFRN